MVYHHMITKITGIEVVITICFYQIPVISRLFIRESISLILQFFPDHQRSHCEFTKWSSSRWEDEVRADEVRADEVQADKFEQTAVP